MVRHDKPFPEYARAWLAGPLICLWLAGCGEPPPSESVAAAADDTPAEHAAKHQDPMYVCPMHPRIVRNEPGSCPICGMDLVLRRLEQGSSGGGGIRLDAAVIQTMGVRTTAATRGALGKRVQALGGAKNHLVVMPDADLDMATEAIIQSAFGRPFLFFRRHFSCDKFIQHDSPHRLIFALDEIGVEFT